LGCTENLQPDLTLLFDVPPKSQRRGSASARTADRFEQEQTQFFARVREVYCKPAGRYAERFIVIDGTQDEKTVRQALKDGLHDG